MNTRFMQFVGRAARRAASLLVFAALAGIVYWGHQTGWKAPRLADLLGGPPPAKEDWCNTHNVPLSRCIACRPELGGADPKDWCKEHGVPESKCTACHPEILTQGKAADWCREHGVPESQCTLCHPDIAVKGRPPASETDATVTAVAAGLPDAKVVACQTHALRVQFASEAAVRKAGVRLEAVQERPMAACVQASAEVEYDQTRLARLSARSPGTVRYVFAQVGQKVAAGEVLALVDAAEVGRAKAEFLQALTVADAKSKTLDRIRTSSREGFRTQAELLEAEATLREARIRLLGAQQALANLGASIAIEEVANLPEVRLAERIRLLGLPDAAVKAIGPGEVTANLIAVTAPLDGTVVACNIVAGEVTDLNKTLFTVADISRMWIVLDVRQEDAARISAGQAVVFRPDAGADAAIAGKVAWISTEADEKTRTVKVRAEVENTDGRLKAHTFGAGRIVVRETPQAVAVPSDAVQWEGCCHVVFVRLGEGIFQTRKVRLGIRSGPVTEVLVGVIPGEVVATTGSHVLKSEILKSRLGAGCCD